MGNIGNVIGFMEHHCGNLRLDYLCSVHSQVEFSLQIPLPLGGRFHIQVLLLVSYYQWYHFPVLSFHELVLSPPSMATLSSTVNEYPANTSFDYQSQILTVSPLSAV